MKSIRLIIRVFTFLYCTILFSQNPSPATPARLSSFSFEGNLAANSMMRGRDILQEVLNIGNKNLTLEDIKGNPYLVEKFEIGILKYTDSTEIGKLPMRYNAYNDEIEVDYQDGAKLLSKFIPISVIVNDKEFRILDYMDNSSTKKGFFIEKLRNTNCSLYVRYEKTLKLPEEAKTSFHKSESPKFIEKKHYYIQFVNQTPIRLKLKKSKILQHFKLHQKKLKEFCSEKKLDLKNENDLIILINYYNSLQ